MGEKLVPLHQPWGDLQVQLSPTFDQLIVRWVADKFCGRTIPYTCRIVKSGDWWHWCISDRGARIRNIAVRVQSTISAGCLNGKRADTWYRAYSDASWEQGKFVLPAERILFCQFWLLFLYYFCCILSLCFNIYYIVRRDSMSEIMYRTRWNRTIAGPRQNDGTVIPVANLKAVSRL